MALEIHVAERTTKTMKADRKPTLVTLKKPESRQPNNGKIPSFSAHRSPAELKAMGKALREKCSRISHAEWKPPHDRPDPLRLFLQADRGRLPDLLPLPPAPLAASPFP